MSKTYPQDQEHSNERDATSPPSEDSLIVSALVRAADERDLRLARARLRECVGAFDRGEKLPGPNIACRFWSDPVPAALTGIRSALAVVITSTFWFATAWPVVSAPT